MRRLLCWLGWHAPDADPEATFYSDRCANLVCRCPACKRLYIIVVGG